MPTESPRSTLMFCAQTRSYGLKVSENVEIHSPSKNAASSVQIKTPVKIKTQQKVYMSLPKHNTPAQKPIKNPFNDRLLELFNAPTCSPDFCSSLATSPPVETKSNEFFWTAEDIWRIDPAPIDSPQTDLEDNLDEETESMAQEAIERYFQESHNVISPIGSPKNPDFFIDRAQTPELPTPKCQSERAMSTPCTRFDSRRSVKTSVAVQTTLSLIDVPESILELLKPYMNVLDESTNQDSLVSNLSSSNLRRKLMFNEFHDSPDTVPKVDAVKEVQRRFLPSDWTPDKVKSTTELLTKSPDVSPIVDGEVKSQSDFFNFTREMAIDSITSPIKVVNRKTDELDMSIDFSGESDLSLIQRRSSHTSADTGYHTHPSSDDKFRLPPESLTSLERADKQFTRSYVGVADASTINTGLTSTPTVNKHRK